jgi:hypothetical protein
MFRNVHANEKRKQMPQSRLNEREKKEHVPACVFTRIHAIDISLDIENKFRMLPFLLLRKKHAPRGTNRMMTFLVLAFSLGPNNPFLLSTIKPPKMIQI